MAKTLTGIVSSDAADKTITITVISRETHPIYGKQYSVTRKYMAHDEQNIAKVGDKVVISECRPFSKKKSFKLDSVIEKARGTIELVDDIAEVIPAKPVKDKDADVNKSVETAKEEK